jgi:tRNA(Ile)-lysidine synthase
VSAAAIEARVRVGALLAPGTPVVVLLSGGRDSVCLLDLAARIAGAGAVTALHLDFGLRDASAADAAHCAALCGRLGVAFSLHRPGAPAGNVQAWARERRYAEARRLARGRDALIATGHTATDQVETVLYRLAASPGRRALLGMPARDGRLVRPLLELSRADTAAYCRERGLAWREDASNAAPDYARNRIRHGLAAGLRDVHPAAEANVLRTLAVLRDEAAVLDDAVGAALRALGDPPGQAALAALPVALARLAVQALADAALPRAPAIGPRLAELLALGGGHGSAELDLGGGLRAVAEYGRLRFTAAPAPPPPAAAALAVPGRTAFAGGELTAERGAELPVGDGTLDAAALGSAALEVRAWRPGDRMRPLGLGGSRSLQDLFTDRKLPRRRRGRWPVVSCGGEIAWVPGVATGERFRVTAGTRERVRLSWRENP